MTIETRTNLNTEYQRKYRERRRQEGYVPVNIFIRKVLRDKIAASRVPLQEFVNDAIEARCKSIQKSEGALVRTSSLARIIPHRKRIKL
jgi:hypothetical protein